MKKNVIVSCAVLGFLALLISPLAAQEEPVRPPRPGFGAEEGFFQRWLDLTPEQEAKLKDMRAAHFEESKALLEKLRQQREDLRLAMGDPKADQKKIEALVDEVHGLMAAQMKARLKFRKDMEKILTPEQLEKLKNARFRMEKMRRGGRFMRRPGRSPRMMGPDGFGGNRYYRGRGFRPGWRWDW